MAARGNWTNRVAQRMADWSAFVAWFALFLLGPATPQLIEQAHSDSVFRALYEGPVYFSDRAAYGLEIQNNGRSPQHNVEVWVPLPPSGGVSLEPSPYEYSNRAAIQARDAGGFRVFNLGDLQAGDRYAVSVNVLWNADPALDRTYASIPWVMAKVVSAERTAESIGSRFRAFRVESSLQWYRDSFYLMSAAVVLLIALLLKAGRQPKPIAAPVPVPKEAWRRPGTPSMRLSAPN